LFTGLAEFGSEVMLNGFKIHYYQFFQGGYKYQSRVFYKVVVDAYVGPVVSQVKYFHSCTLNMSGCQLLQAKTKTKFYPFLKEAVDRETIWIDIKSAEMDL
jgi:hypothetical protein